MQEARQQRQEQEGRSSYWLFHGTRPALAIPLEGVSVVVVDHGCCGAELLRSLHCELSIESGRSCLREMGGCISLQSERQNFLGRVVAVMSQWVEDGRGNLGDERLNLVLWLTVD